MGFFILLWSLAIGSVSAAGVIPRGSDLRLELSLATGAVDTSGNNRPVSTATLAPTYETDPQYNISVAKFRDTSWLRVNTAWNPAGPDDLAISFWIKKPEPVSQVNVITGSLMSSPSYAGPIQYSTFYADPVFISASGSTTDTTTRLLLTPNGKCVIRWGIGSWVLLGWAPYNANYSTALLRAGDYGNAATDQFNCSQIFDNKWHHIVMNKKAWWLIFMVDGTEIYRVNGAFTLPRDLLIGYSNHFTQNYYSGAGYNPTQTELIRSNHHSKSSLAGFRLYSRSLTADEIEALGDEYRTAQSNLVGVGNITMQMNGYTSPNLSVTLRGIAANLSKDTVEYQYALSGGVFNPITQITDLSVSTGSLIYRVSLGLAWVPDGKVNLILRVKSGATVQNIGNVSFTKLETVSSIVINNPTTDIATVKSISAIATGATLSAWLTRSAICDATIEQTYFGTDTDFTFTNKADNGIRVCYRAHYPATNKTIYKISPAIAGIQSEAEWTSATNATIFKDYLLWRKSSYQKPNDSTAMLLDLLGVSATQSQGTINGITMTDINGDGLVDFIYSRSDAPVKRAIIVNNGNYTFKTVYKCVIEAAIYYGDCSDPTR
jgi:hypothetical protein